MIKISGRNITAQQLQLFFFRQRIEILSRTAASPERICQRERVRENGNCIAVSFPALRTPADIPG